MNKYTGFYIEDAIGNNIFSYVDRENKKIYVPKLIEGTLDDVLVGEEIVFNEIDEDIEIKAKGLKNMVIYKYKDKDIYIFDNHNHAFYFWIKCLDKGNFTKGCKLVHVDQHKDTREPDNYNVDLDIFSKDMDYIPYDIKISRIKELIDRAKVITIASSPFFINQEYAIKVLKELFNYDIIE